MKRTIFVESWGCALAFLSLDTLIFHSFVYLSSLHSNITFSGRAIKSSRSKSSFFLQVLTLQLQRSVLPTALSLGVCRVTHALHLPKDCGPGKKPIVFPGTLNQSTAARLRLAGASPTCRHRATMAEYLFFFFSSAAVTAQRNGVNVHVCDYVCTYLRALVPPLNGSRHCRWRCGLLLLSKTGQMPVSLEQFR